MHRGGHTTGDAHPPPARSPWQDPHPAPSAPIATYPPPWALQIPWHWWLRAPVSRQPSQNAPPSQVPPAAGSPPSSVPPPAPVAGSPPALPCCARAAWCPGTRLPRGACPASRPPASAGSGIGQCRLPAGSPTAGRAGWAAGGDPARPSRRRASPAPARRAAWTSAACTCGTPAGRSPTSAPAASPPRSAPRPPPQPPHHPRRPPPVPGHEHRGGGRPASRGLGHGVLGKRHDAAVRGSGHHAGWRAG